MMAWYVLPLITSISVIAAACFWPMDDDFSADIRRIGFVVLALVASNAIWIIGGFCK